MVAVNLIFNRVKSTETNVIISSYKTLSRIWNAEERKEKKHSKFGGEAIKFNQVILEGNAATIKCEWSESKWIPSVELIWAPCCVDILFILQSAFKLYVHYLNPYQSFTHTVSTHRIHRILTWLTRATHGKHIQNDICSVLYIIRVRNVYIKYFMLYSK